MCARNAWVIDSGQRSRSALSTGTGDRTSRRARLALWTFVGIEAATVPLWLLHARSLWFFADEWDFLAGRTGGDLGDLFRPHNSHWSTLPILTYRLLWWLAGLRSYLPYVALLVLLHVTAAALLRMVMRRAGVGPWIATAAASAFALFGSGYQNIVWAFQIGFTGALVFGLTHLLLADHDGPIDRRDWLGCLAGLAALLCSGVGVAMVVVVGVATLLRRGWRVAALHTVPLALVYAVWWVSIGNEPQQAGQLRAVDLARFVKNGIQGVFGALGQLTGVGLALGVLLVVGLAVAWAPLDWAQFRRRAAAPGALLLGVFIFLILSGVWRVGFLGPESARASRYLHPGAAFVLPAVAVAADAVARRWRLAAPVMLVVLVVGIPGNIRALTGYTRDQKQARHDYRKQILALPRTPVADEVPRTVRPETTGYDSRTNVTIGWLLDGAASGRIPDPGQITPALAAANTFRLSFWQTHSGSRRTGCKTISKPITRHLEKGDAIGISGWLVRVTSGAGASAGTSVVLDPRDGDTVVGVQGPSTVQVAANSPFFPVTICDLSFDQRAPTIARNSS
jgi:hypothetical protein